MEVYEVRIQILGSGYLTKWRPIGKDETIEFNLDNNIKQLRMHQSK